MLFLFYLFYLSNLYLNFTLNLNFRSLSLSFPLMIYLVLVKFTNGLKDFTIVNNVYGGIGISGSGPSVLTEGGVTCEWGLLTCWSRTVGEC